MFPIEYLYSLASDGGRQCAVFTHTRDGGGSEPFV